MIKIKILLASVAALLFAASAGKGALAQPLPPDQGQPAPGTSAPPPPPDEDWDPGVPPADANAPGPFAFADEERLRDILSNAGFGAIDVQRFDAAIALGATPRSAAENAVQIGPVSRLVREVGAKHLPVILDAVERTLAPLAAPDGHVSLNGSTWIVSATNPA